jgi:tetratricopeptide (TPR) repeat protein
VGDFERARTYAHSAVELSEQNDNRELRARSQRLLGIALRELGESEPALVSFEAALAYYDSGRGKPTERVAATIDYAVALRRAGQSGRAAELARKVYADRAKLGDRQIRGDAILKSAGLLEAANRRDALRLIRESLELFTAAEYRIGQIEAYAALADWYLAAGRLGESVSYGMRAIKLADTMESFLEAERQGPAFKDKTFDVYGTVISALLQDRGSDRQSAAARAFEVVSRAKAQRARIRLDGTDESLRSKRRAVSDAMIARMKAAESGDADSVASAQLRVVRAVDAFEAAISAQGLGADTVRHRATLRFTQAALPQNTLLLVFLWSRDRGWRFEIDRATLKVAELPPASTLEPIINAVYRALQESHRFPVRYARQLGRILLPEALPDVETILVLPDGPLNVLPLGVLAQPGRDGYIPVARRFTVSHLTALPAGPSAARADRIELERGIALVVDPFVAQQRPMDPGSAWRGWPGGQGPLPWSVREAEAIAKLFRDKPVTILRGERATVAALEAPGVVDKAILHIATHGFFSSELDNMAALIFFRQQGGSRASDALLTPQDARVLPLAANLVVLNGCQTAIGASFRGEGIGGMTRAFIDNGASSAIGTLWQVPDRAAARLLTRFYEILMAQNGSDVATALAASKREFMDSGRYRNPFFWAGYVHHTTLQLVH